MTILLLSLANITLAKCHSSGVIVTHVDRKLRSYAYSHLCSNLSSLVEKFVPVQHLLTHFEKCINHIKKLEPIAMREKKSHVNDQLSLNSLLF